MNLEMYVFESGRLVGMQRVGHWSTAEIDRAVEAVKFFGRTGEISDKGISICMFCKLHLGACEVEAGQISHGCCPSCYDLVTSGWDPEMEGL